MIRARDDLELYDIIAGPLYSMFAPLLIEVSLVVFPNVTASIITMQVISN